MTFNAVKTRIRRTSLQKPKVYYYWLTLISGAEEEAIAAQSLIPIATQSLIPKGNYWFGLVQIFNSLYNRPNNFNPKAYLASGALFSQKNAMHLFAAAMIVYDNNKQDQQLIAQYLEQMKDFPINLANKEESIALMMLQRQAGLSQSQISAKALFDKLKFYHKNHRQSFEFWNLGAYLLIAKLHCGPPCPLPQHHVQQNPLDPLFKPNHSYWMDDIGFVRVALADWANEPLVIEYFNRIEQDRKRFRMDNGL
jgi:hypothetical protein